MKKIAVTAAMCALAFGTLGAMSNARAGCKPPVAISGTTNAQPMKDCVVEAESVFQRFFNLFK